MVSTDKKKSHKEKQNRELHYHWEFGRFVVYAKTCSRFASVQPIISALKNFPTVTTDYLLHHVYKTMKITCGIYLGIKMKFTIRYEASLF